VINANFKKKKSANVGVKHQSINHKIPRFPQKKLTSRATI
jgi:hypothetical protein